MNGHRFAKGGIALAMLATVLVTSTPQIAQALTSTVTTILDAPDPSPGDGICTSTLPGAPCTLRAAVQTANANPGFDSIAFSAALVGTSPSCTGALFQLTVPGADENSAATGDLDITGPLSISEPCEVSVSSQSGNDRVWDIFADTSFYQVATMDGSVTGTADHRGAGILVRSPAVVNLQRSNVIDNGTGVVEADSEGGGIYAEAGTSVTMSNSILGGGHAAAGGGIFTSGHLDLRGFVGFVSGNTALANGAGIFLASGATANIGGLTQSNSNHAIGNGGFLYAARGSTASLWSNTIETPEADGLGGIAFIEDGATVGIVDTAFKNASAAEGGGIWNSGSLTVVGSGFEASNAATGDGGAIYNAATGRVEIQRSFGVGNHANNGLGDGGFLFNLGTAVVANTSIGSSSAENEGSGIWTSGPLDLRFSAITNGIGNTGPGVGLFVEPGTADVRVSNSVMVDNFGANGSDDCIGPVTLVGVLVTQINGCFDNPAAPGGGSLVNASMNFTFAPAAAGFLGGQSVIPQLVTADPNLQGAADATECAAVASDGYGRARLGAGDTTCDAGPVEGSAGASVLSLASRTDVFGVAPAFRNLPLEDLPPAAISGGLAVAGGGTTESSPLARIDFSATLDGTSAVETTPLARIPLARIPLARIPLARIPLARIGLAKIPLARIPLARIAGNPAAIDTWDEMVAGSLLAKRPLTSTTLADVLDPANWPNGGLDQFITRFEALTLDQIDLSDTAIGRMPVDALSIADINLAEVSIAPDQPLPADPNQARVQNLENWCDYFVSQGFSCANTFGINPQQPATGDGINLTVVAMVGVPLARIPLARIPLARIPLARIPLLDTPLARIDYRNTPLARIPLARINVAPTPLARIPLASTAADRATFIASTLGKTRLVDQFSLSAPGALPASLSTYRLVDAAAGSLIPLVDCAVVNCASTTSTVRTAFDSVNGNGQHNGIRPTATVGDLLRAFTTLKLGDIAPWAAGATETTLTDFADLAGLTVNDLYAAVLAPERDAITLGSVLNGFVAREDVAWDSLDLGSPQLAGIVPSGGTATYSVVIGTNQSSGAQILSIVLPPGWKLVPGGVVDDGTVVDDSRISTSGQTSEVQIPAEGFSSIVRVTAFTGLDTGLHDTTFAVRYEHEEGTPTPPKSSSARDAVAGSYEPNGTPAEAATAVGGTAINPDTLYVSTINNPGDVDLWPIIVPRGYQLSISLTGMTSDYDVVVYSPPGATEDSLVGLDGGLRQAPTSTLPYLPDFGLGLGRDDTRVQPERLQDIPLQAGRRVYAASLDRGATPERIDTPALGGGLYLIQVTGFNGASGNDPYGLRASVRPSVASTSCPTVRPPLRNAPLPTFPAPVGAATTLFVLHSARFGDTWAPVDPTGTANVITELTSTVTAINQSPAAYGGGSAKVLDLATVSTVNDAYLQWDAGRCEPARANRVVKAIGSAIDAAVAANGQPFENIVLIGADDIIPMARVVDGTTLGNEREYARIFASNNELSSALSYGVVLTDDPYGDARPVQIAGRELYVPELAVGRLVEQPAQIAQSLNMYRTSLGVLDANTAAVTGYEFLSDGAEAVRATLSQSTSSVTPLISNAWTKAQLNGILSSTTKLLSINAHFDHQRALPADQSASGKQSDPVDATSLAFEGGRRLLFSMGCHAGLSVSDVSLGVASAADNALKPDWAQQLAQNGDLLVGNTGYGYGDTDVVAASEKLMTYFAQRLDGSVSIGDAMQLAKQRYSADLPVITPYDEKVLQEVVMYGLPMYRVRSTPGPLPTRPDGPTPVAGPPNLQLTSFGVNLGVESDANPNTADLERRTIGRGTYWTVQENPANRLENNGRILTAQYRPIQPQYAVEVTNTTGTAEARGALITSLSSVDINNVNPANFRPTIDLSANEPEPVVDDAAFPDRIQGLTSFSDAAGGRQQLILSVGQFLQNPAATNGSGTQRLFKNVGGTVYYADANNTDRTAPTIQRTDAVNEPGVRPQFDVVASDDVGLLRVVVLSTDVENPGVWQTTELSLSFGVWRGTAALPSTGPSVLYFVQAVDVNGNVAVSSNKAVYYVAAPADLTPPTVSAVAAPASLVTNQNVTVTITASDGPDGSGIAYLSYVRNGVPTTVINTTGAEPFSTSFVVTAGGTTTVSYSAIDNRENVSADGSISVGIDRQAATITPTVSPAPVGNWIRAASAAVSATVVEAGVATGGPLTYGSTGALSVPPGTAVPVSPIVVTALGVSTLTFSTTDAAGNAAQATAVVRLDPTAPTVNVTTPPATPATYALNQVVLASYTCADPAPGSGIASCVGTVANGAAINTATAGVKTFRVTGTDVAGNSTIRDVSYTVAAAPTNTAPVVRADWGVGARNVGFFNDVATVQGSFTDAGDIGPWRVTVTWGNGKTATTTRTTTGAFTLTSPAYNAAGTFTAVITVCDAGNKCSSDTVTIRTRVAKTGLKATVVCVVDGGPRVPVSVGRYTATFSWKNSQTYWIYAPIGPNNSFVIPPLDRGQPTLFSPGQNTTPVTAKFALLGSGWWLGDTVAVATILTRRC